MNDSINKSLIFITVIWIVLFGTVYFLITIFFENDNNPNKNINLINGADGNVQLVLKRNKYGHYIAPGVINGKSVNFMLDTGATFVSIPAKKADFLGLNPGAHGISKTANGEVNIRFTTINTLIIGPFQINKVPAILNPGQTDDQILLGMNVLKNLEFSQSGKNLIIKLRSQ
jgi:aspartyl protease family protein